MVEDAHHALAVIEHHRLAGQQKRSREEHVAAAGDDTGVPGGTR
jgi:hypothetical protein